LPGLAVANPGFHGLGGKGEGLSMKRVITGFLLAMLVSSCDNPGSKKPTIPTPSITQSAEKNPIVLSFSIMQGSSSAKEGVDRVGFIRQGCLENVDTCPANIFILPNAIAQNDMVPDVTWSPDGKTLLFFSDLSGNQDIYIENADGSDLTNITNSPDREDCPVWAPDGEHILFSRETTIDGNTQDQIWIAKPDGSGARLVAEGDCPVWFPNSGDILYAKQKNQLDGLGHVTSALYTTRISDIFSGGSPGDPIPLIDGLTFVSGPVYSPDGKKIAFLEEENNYNILKVMNADGKHIVAFTEIEGESGYPAWSPDGARLAFTVNKSHTSPADIFILSVDARTITRVTEAPEMSTNMDPTWSPDGTMLAFTSTMPSGHFEIMIYNIAKKKLLKLTSASIDNEYYNPSWRPLPN
jgi:Tol biopolymer transport system component